jgi:hypothetical protein
VAAKRVVQSLHGFEAVRWMVALVSVNAKELRASDRVRYAKLTDELERWLGVTEDPALIAGVRRLRHDPAAFQPLIDEVAEVVTAVADRKKFSFHYDDGHIELDPNRFAKGAARAVSYRFTALHDAIMHVACDDLNHPDALRVRRCREQSCRKIFVAARSSQLYCSHRCANLEASRRYRAANRLKRAAHERARYESNVRKRVGNRNIRIQHRPRLKPND